MKRPFRIGIPRSILFYKYYEQWKSLFNTFDLEVITSPMTTEGILRDGIRHSVSDLCLSVKSFFGHVYHLKDEVDCLFIPRYVSVEKDAYMCPKILGLPDMVKAVFLNLPKILSPKFNIKEGKEKTIDEFTMTIARFFFVKA